jgi:ribosomal protein S18 acetylase RimI-like enzyme
MNLTAFRPANLNDVTTLVQLVNTAYHPDPDAGSWTNESRFVLGTRTNEKSLENLLVKSDSIVLLGLQEDVVSACVHLEIVENHAHIGMLAVKPSLQCAGIGKQILAEAEAYASNHFKAEKFVLIVISLREELIAFYLRRGYHKTERMIDYALLCGETCDAKIDGLKFVVLEKLVSSRKP